MTSGSSLLVVIVGCGRMGSFLADRLSGKEHRVIVVDSREAALQKLSIEFSGRRVLGNATEFSVLKQAQVDEADVVLAVTHDDNVNMMVTQVARDVLRAYGSALGTVGLSVGVMSAEAPISVLWAEIAGMFLGRLEIFVVLLALRQGLELRRAR